ncbi:MAG: hypothetical protein KAQ98_10060 [Bacteriovoracaceae bacterium]|nr:hypothetical protein [Bacteriovoracaceae bacterium]
MNQCKQLCSEFATLGKILSRRDKKDSPEMVDKLKRIVLEFKLKLRKTKKRLIELMIEDYYVDEVIERDCLEVDQLNGFAFGYPVPLDVYYRIISGF